MHALRTRAMIFALVSPVLLAPAAAGAQGYSFCTDLLDVVNAAPAGFAGLTPGIMPAAESCGVTKEDGAAAFRCKWQVAFGDEKSGTIWFAKHVQRCFPKWKYEPNYNAAAGPHAKFESGKAVITVTRPTPHEVAVTVIK